MGEDGFRVVVRQSGLPFTDGEVGLLFEGYRKLERMLDCLDPPFDPTTTTGVVFKPMTGL